MIEYGACYLDIWEPDVANLKAQLRKAGHSPEQIEALPRKWFAKRLSGSTGHIRV